MTGELFAFPSKAPISVDAPPAPTYGGGSGGGNVTDITMKDYVDAQTAATRSQNDARFAEMLSELRSMKADTDGQFSSLRADISIIQRTMLTWPTFLWTTITASATVIFSVVGLVYAIISYGADRFDGGAQFTASTYQASQDAKSLSQENARQIQQLGDDVTKLIEALANRPQTPPAP